MPLTETTQFFPFADLHVLRGQPVVALSELLSVTWQATPDPISGTLAQYLNQPAHPQDVTVDFRPTFQFEDQGDVLVNDDFGISIRKTTGVITIAQDVPLDPWPHNFIVEAVVTRNDAGVPPQSLKVQALRIHVHRSVARIWATPKRLSLRRTSLTGANEAFHRFTVRAEFDDGIVADITDSGRFAPKPADAECFGTSNGVIIPASLAAGAPPRTVTFVTTPEWGSVEGSAEIAALLPWDAETNVPQAELISGHPRVLDGTLSPEKVPNIVFISSGFAAADQGAFETITDTLVHRLRTDPQLSPYRYLTGAMNFWRIPIVAPEAGVNVRMEVFPFKRDADLFTLPMQTPARPPSSGQWKLRHLLYVAGLPMPTDTVGQVTIDKIRERWSITLRPSFVPLINDRGVVSDALVEWWQRCAGRTFIDEVDQFPAVSVGPLPSLQEEDVGELKYDERRNGVQPVDEQNNGRKAFFQRVTAKPKNGTTLVLGDTPNAIGNLWAEMRDSFAFDHRTFVVDICNMPTGHIRFGRAGWAGLAGLIIRPTVRLPTAIANITNEVNLPGISVVKDPVRNALTQKLPSLDSTELQSQAWQTIAHEVAHAFLVGDEYALAGATMVPGGYPPLQDRSNLMYASDVLKPDGVTADIAKIKWNWHRIAAASLLTGAINPLGGENYEVPVAPKSGFRFRSTQPMSVFLRQRARLKAFPTDRKTSEECKVVSVSADGSIVKISRASGTLDLHDTFPAGSILYAPVPAPVILQPPRPFLTIVSPLVERLMAKSGTLSGKSCNLSDETVYGARVQAPVLSTELDNFGPMNALPRIVGVYYGGQEFACGVVHPAGSCQMRNGFDAYTHFCHVCQYALADQIDPEQHGLVDRDHGKFYTL